MIYDYRFFDHLISLKSAKGQQVSTVIRTARLLVSNRLVGVAIDLFERLLSVLLTLPIPLYSDLVLTLVTYFPGSPFLLGNYIRGIYWKRKLGRMGKNCIIEQGVVIRYPSDVVFDDFVLIDKNVLLEAGKIRIGRRVHIAENCVISGGGEFVMEAYSCMSHSSAAVTASDTPQNGFRGSGPMVPWEQRHVVIGKIMVKKDAFIGMGARILPNVTIEEGAVVAAGALINRDVPPWSIVAGVPARTIGEREMVVFPDV
jgi:acetyltransferase-like isoleucine patch superfamily enzyme